MDEARPAQPRVDQAGLPSKVRVLLVDDEPSVVRVLRRRLETQGYEVVVAMDGMAALDMAKEGQPHLIILDLMLPRLNGYEVCRMLKQDPRYAQIPVLILTARGGPADKQEGLECGAEGYLIKPCQPDALLAEVQRLLNNYSKSA